MCRRRDSRKHKTKEPAEPGRSSENQLHFCLKPVDFNPSTYDIETDGAGVRMDGEVSFVSTIKECFRTRHDEWGIYGLGRIEYYLSNLHAADAVYHKACSTNFRTGRQIPLQYSEESKAKAG